MSLSRTVAMAASVVALMVSASSEVRAQDLSDNQVWMQVLAIGQLSENWRSHVELQPRFMDNASELGLTIVRSLVGRQVSRRATVWGGYAWVPRTLGPGVLHEQRIWEQLTVTGPAPARWATSGRFRLEQRFLGVWGDSSHRFRALVRAQRPLGGGRWSVAAYDEAMFTLDETSPGPPRGYDRNRLYGGVVRRLSPAVSLEGGYIWENSTISGSTRRNENVVIAIVNLALPRRQ